MAIFLAARVAPVGVGDVGQVYRHKSICGEGGAGGSDHACNSTPRATTALA